ncbi:hypothetical protein JD844_020022 [Phrynosoma platyrhinos]|uniref:WKF domain-containing protein n=1 Tax=Phrynosoma platyrhinos TaxID=52577 RepID=A0ABQ7TRL2_PHRPL|nr:hypothetical protein JD844_020022 [Phrynosoma platyrhinos]
MSLDSWTPVLTLRPNQKLMSWDIWELPSLDVQVYFLSILSCLICLNLPVYLFPCSWSESPKEWKFQKTRQTWLLLHMYDKEKVPDKYFSILLRYLEGLQGSARDTTVQKAETLMKEYDKSETEDSTLLEKRERIRKVLQLLS